MPELFWVFFRLKDVQVKCTLKFTTATNQTKFSFTLGKLKNLISNFQYHIYMKEDYIDPALSLEKDGVKNDLARGSGIKPSVFLVTLAVLRSKDANEKLLLVLWLKPAAFGIFPLVALNWYCPNKFLESKKGVKKYQQSFC